MLDIRDLITNGNHVEDVTPIRPSGLGNTQSPTKYLIVLQLISHLLCTVHINCSQNVDHDQRLSE